MCRAVYFVLIVAMLQMFSPACSGWNQSLPEVCLGELLHVELLVCEGGQVDVPDSWEHFT